MKNIFKINQINNEILKKLPEGVIKKCSLLKIMLFDVDGILTDGNLIYDINGEKLKIFNALDGYGITSLIESGIHVGIVSGRFSQIVCKRAAELNINVLKQGINDKAKTIEKLSKEMNIGLENFGFMGDDIIDIPAMNIISFSATVPNAPEYLKKIASWVSTKNGGNGAVRECCDIILSSKNRR